MGRAYTTYNFCRAEVGIRVLVYFYKYGQALCRFQIQMSDFEFGKSRTQKVKFKYFDGTNLYKDVFYFLFAAPSHTCNCRKQFFFFTKCEITLENAIVNTMRTMETCNF